VSTSDHSRRDILRTSAAGLAAAALPGCTGKGGGADTAVTLSEGSIDHVVVVMMENRSFDHFLGALTVAEGRTDVDGLTGKEVNADAAGELYFPERLTEACQIDPPHSWSRSHNQFNDGANDGFVLEHEKTEAAEAGQVGWVMGYYTREDLPTHFTLADQFCLPDRYFCSVMSSTWPNRMYGQTGTSLGEHGNDLPSGGYTQPSVYSKIEEAGLDWRYYYTDVPFIGLLSGVWDDSKIGFIEDFFEDAAADKLPPFTWIDPGFSYNDDHPPHHVRLGQLFLAMVYEALAQSPAWERTLLIITYDEHGGFYDHVPPTLVADEHKDFEQLGFRVPSLIVGPWVRQGVDGTTYDHTSILKYVCERFGIEPWNTRIADAQSLAACLDTERMASGIPLEAVSIPAFDAPSVEELDPECNYGDIVSAQPELAAWIQANMPGTDRSGQIPEIHQKMLSIARGLGLIEDPGLV